MSAARTTSRVSYLFDGTAQVVGQEKARRQMAVLLARQADVAAGRYAKAQSAIVAGFTGTGKTYMTRLMCELAGLPFAEVNATQYTESGYAGDDLSQMFVPLLESAAAQIDAERGEERVPILGPSEAGEAGVLKRDDIDKVVERAQTGVVFLDEFDKWTQRFNHATGRMDTAIQAELLKIIEGSTVYVTDNEDELGVLFDTSRVLVICAGAFVGLASQVSRRLQREEEIAKVASDPGFWDLIEQVDFVKFGLIPELAGRLGIHIFLRPLQPAHLGAILREEGGIVDEYRERFEAAGCEWDVPDHAIDHLAGIALHKDVGARGIDNVLWTCFSEALFMAETVDWPAVVRVRVNQHRASLEAV